jgi:hypothetical protein
MAAQEIDKATLCPRTLKMSMSASFSVSMPVV